MNIVCILTDEGIGIGEPWEYTPKCSQCKRWCKEYADEWNGDRRCPRCAERKARR